MISPSTPAQPSPEEGSEKPIEEMSFKELEEYLADLNAERMQAQARISEINAHLKEAKINKAGRRVVMELEEERTETIKDLNEILDDYKIAKAHLNQLNRSDAENPYHKHIRTLVCALLQTGVTKDEAIGHAVDIETEIQALTPLATVRFKKKLNA